MADKTGIEWTDATWNPVTGCAKVSQGCKHCYAEREWPRLTKLVPAYAGRDFTDVRTHSDRLAQPLRWQKPRMIFVNSMSDLFHPDVPFEFINLVFAVMSIADRHVFQVLTKRPERMREYLRDRDRVARIRAAALLLNGDIDESAICQVWPLPNVWLGVSVEDQAAADARIPLLLDTPAAVRWISAEPLLGSVRLSGLFGLVTDDEDVRIDALAGTFVVSRHQEAPTPLGSRVDWVVVGGESGPKARPMHPAWARSLRDQCAAASVPFLFKQHGEWLATTFCDDDAAMLPVKQTVYVRPDGSFHDGANGVDFFGGEEETSLVGKKAAGRLLDGVEHNGYPAGHWLERPWLFGRDISAATAAPAGVPDEIRALAERCCEDYGTAHSNVTIYQLASFIRSLPVAPAVSAFPERDPSLPAEAQGLFRKFDVRRVDGRDAPGGKHHNCRYFVLDLDHDRHAPAAMWAYAADCRATHPQLSAGIAAEFDAPAASADAEDNDFQSLIKASEDFDCCNETDIDYETLMRLVNRGWLECTYFEVTDKGRAALAASREVAA